ncbi:MAG: polymer-forming cytoskeletal protein [Bacteroidales bacterium]|jgi:cytoskeletal protein CcmA (bactofilin family)|nr:polymer-forming cytoskeletal protein [Bacteroidales bacterium]
MAKVTVQETPSVNIIGPMTKLDGNLKCNGDIRIEGSLKGSIDCSGKLVVGNTGEVEGDISCRNGDFSGTIKGLVTVTELLVLKSTATMEGDLSIGKLAIEPGARFSGKCTMDLTANLDAG